ncbi:small-conductance mechanosensitive channel [Rhodobium orientis]|uniref:DUF3772 domain-containing protein n=1 Tax=Rhodobium orientis TaxID=34017 RepID=UPI00160FD836|nr:small-conductance mechanosensitive channel [Rhodobium orientis]
MTHPGTDATETAMPAGRGRAARAIALAAALAAGLALAGAPVGAQQSGDSATVPVQTEAAPAASQAPDQSAPDKAVPDTPPPADAVVQPTARPLDMPIDRRQDRNGGSEPPRPADADTAAPAAPAPSAGTQGTDAPQPETAPASAPEAAPAGGEVDAELRTTTPLAIPMAELRKKLEAWERNLNQMTAALQREGLTNRDLNELQGNLEVLRLDTLQTQKSISPAVDALNARIQQLAPAEDETVESREVKENRTELEKERAQLEGLVKQIGVATLRAEELVAAVNDRKRTLFARRLFERERSIADPTLWLNALNDLPAALGSLALLAVDWWGLLKAQIGEVAGIVLIAMGGLILTVVAVFHRLLLRKSKRMAMTEEPPLLKKVWAALVVMLVNMMLPLIGVGAFFGIIEAIGASPDRIDNFSWTIIFTVLTLSATHGLTRAILAPGRPNWRMVPLTDGAVDRLIILIFSIAVMLAANVLLDGIARNLFAPISLTLLVHGSFAVVYHLLILSSVRIVARGRIASGADDQASAGRFWSWFIPLVTLASIAGLFGTMLGFIAFGWFVAIQIIWTVTVLSLLHLLLIFVDETLTTGLRNAAAARIEAGDNLVSQARSEQVGVVLSGLFRIILMGLAAVLILTPWGVQSTKLLGSLEAVFFGIQVGDVTFSLSAVLIALGIFLTGYAFTRSIQSWMENRLLPSTSLDIGLKTSIKTAVGYVGVIVAGMIAFSYIGLDLQNIAIVAGALSVGIGFGLQSIVNNFVSGLILLAERPIKVGDWIVVGSEQGFVKRINVRATEIETFDRAAVIVPNSDLISGVVKNWMHNDVTGRIIVPVGVAYGSDPDQVREILMECAREQKMILAYPAPSVFFMNFGDSSLDFELRCYVSDVGYLLGTASDLRYDIYRRFGEAGVEIPFPQRDINLRDMDRLEKLMDKRKAGRAKPKTADTPRDDRPSYADIDPNDADGDD